MLLLSLVLALNWMNLDVIFIILMVKLLRLESWVNLGEFIVFVKFLVNFDISFYQRAFTGHSGFWKFLLLGSVILWKPVQLRIIHSSRSRITTDMASLPIQTIIARTQIIVGPLPLQHVIVFQLRHRLTVPTHNIISSFELIIVRKVLIRWSTHYELWG